MINVDISNIWGEVSLPDLLAMEHEVFDAHKALTEGTASGCPVWPEPSLPEPDGELQRILEAARQIRESSDAVVVAGIGGNHLGSRAAIELLQGPNRNFGRGKGDPQILYAGNSLSTRHWNELVHLLEGKDFSVIVISKSGTTLEPAIAFRALRWMLERKYGTDQANRRIFAVTNPHEGALRRMAAEEGWELFAIPDAVNSPFSVLTPAGLLPMAVAGIDILALLKGAADARESYDIRSFENPVWLYAAVRSLLYRSGKVIELLESFEPGFRMFGSWWQQLFGSSGGKDGKGLFPATAELPADLHSLGQLIQQGEQKLFETLLRFDPPMQRHIIGPDWKNLDDLNYLEGKYLSYVEEMACQAAVDTHADCGVSVITMDCGELDAGKVGELFYFFGLSCGICAYILGVNPFDQPGAALYRENMLRLLGKPDCSHP